MFLGGWAPFNIGVAGVDSVLNMIPGIVWFLGKTFAVVWLLMWVRWTFPRLRIDQIAKGDIHEKIIKQGVDNHGHREHGQTQRTKAKQGLGCAQTLSHSTQLKEFQGQRNEGDGKDFHRHRCHKLEVDLLTSEHATGQKVGLKEHDSQRHYGERHNGTYEKDVLCTFHLSFFISVRLMMARPSVTSSVYSSSSPTEMPRAMTLILTS